MQAAGSLGGGQRGRVAGAKVLACLSKPDRYPLFGLSLFASPGLAPAWHHSEARGGPASARAPGLLSPLSPGKNLASNVSA